MANNKREPDGIRRKKKRRAPTTLDEIEKQRNIKTHDKKGMAKSRDYDYGFDDYDDDSDVASFRKIPDDKNQRTNILKKLSLKKAIKIAVSLIVILVLFTLIIPSISFFTSLDNSETCASSAPTGDSVNILVLGLDIGNTASTEDVSLKRTDTMMLVNYNKSTKDVNIVSIPRDTLVTINGANYKINAANVLGGDTQVISSVENLLSIDVNYLVKIDYEAFRDFIDAIGGVDMYIEQDMIYDDDEQDLHINFTGGTTVHLDGEKAEEFFRWRKNNDGTGLATGDLGRIENQHEFIQAVIDKCKTPTILFKVPTILSSIAENMDTNMTSLDLINYGMKFLTSNSINMTTLQGTAKTISGQSYLVYDESSNTDILSILHSGTSSSSSSSNSSETKKSTAKVLVLNGTKITGLAAAVKSTLEDDGWTSVDTGNADITSTSVIQTDDSSLKKLIKNNLTNISDTESKPDDEAYSSYDVVIVIGTDYKKLGE